MHILPDTTPAIFKKAKDTDDPGILAILYFPNQIAQATAERVLKNMIKNEPKYDWYIEYVPTPEEWKDRYSKPYEEWDRFWEKEETK